MIIAGDFNSSVSPTPRLVGPRTLTPQEARPDEAEFTNFVRTHHLTVLNTWQVSSPHTFVQGDSRTQIDFLLTKVSSSGGSAKQAPPLANYSPRQLEDRRASAPVRQGLSLFDTGTSLAPEPNP